MEENLLIGNGFDLHHGLPTQWRDFKKYIEDKNIILRKNKIYINLLKENYEFWSDVEAYLGEWCTEFLTEENQKEVLNFLNDFTLEFQKYLVTEVEPKIKELKPQSDILELLKTQRIIYTTNYTTTLETLYKIPKNKIVYLHGKITEFSTKQLTVIIGCDLNKKIENVLSKPIITMEKKKNMNNLKEYSEVGITKEQLMYLQYGESGYLSDEAPEYFRKLSDLRGCLVKSSNFIHGTNNFIGKFNFFGFSFGTSDSVINNIIIKELSTNNRRNITIYSYRREGILDHRIKEFLEENLKINSSEVKSYMKELVKYELQ